jgi:uncharacterized protein (TIGR02145 family)
VIQIPGNDKGVWVVGNARTNGSFSATVQLLTATAAADFSGACAYASNYPPVGEYTATDKITFTGTPPYDIVFSGSGGSLSINGSDYTIPSGVTITSFSDKTGAPGKLNCMSPAIYTLLGSDVCLNNTVTLTLSGSQSGWRYQLYKGSTAIGAVVNGTGSALTFSETGSATGTFNYTVQTVDPTGVQCEMPASNVRSITVAALPTVPGATVNFTAFCPASNAATGATWTLQDTRESNNIQSYKVKKMADDHIWMVQDMKFGDRCNKTTFAGSFGSDRTGSNLTSLGGYIYGDCMNGKVESTPSNRGYLYDWAGGAIQKAGAYSGSTLTVGCSGTASGTSGTAPGACRGICPEGWHIPTGGSDGGEFQALHNAIGGCVTTNDDCWNAASAWEGVYGGYCYHNAWLFYQGSIGFYWSSTYGDTNGAYILSFSRGDEFLGTLNLGTLNYGKHGGSPVRCIRNY